MSSICSVESLSSSHPVGSKDRSLIGSLQADWRSMFYHENSKDISVIIEDGQCIRLHSLVLLARCGNNGRLQYETSSQINCRHLQASSVKKILLYLYSAELEVVEASDIVPLLVTAHEFRLDNLRPYFLQCTDYLLTQINICEVLNTAQSRAVASDSPDELVHDLWCVVDSCLHFISRNVERVMGSDVVNGLSSEALKLAVSSKLPMTNKEMLRCILRWARCKVGTNKVHQSDWSEEERKSIRTHIEEIIPHVQLADGRPLSPDSISDGVYGILERYSWAAEQCSGNSVDCSDTVLSTESVILSQLQSCVVSIINEWCAQSTVSWYLLYRGSTHGFTAKQFHSRCDNHGPTLIVIQTTQGHVFGGYSDVSWHVRNKRGKFSRSQHSFLFTLSKCAEINTSSGPMKYCIRQPSYAINSHPGFGPIFGSGADLSISNDCNVNEESYSRFPSSYGDDNAHPHSLTLTPYFKVHEYEVFGLK